jgi:hypothetical protein
MFSQMQLGILSKKFPCLLTCQIYKLKTQHHSPVSKYDSTHMLAPESLGIRFRKQLTSRVIWDGLPKNLINKLLKKTQRKVGARVKTGRGKSQHSQ